MERLYGDNNSNLHKLMALSSAISPISEQPGRFYHQPRKSPSFDSRANSENLANLENLDSPLIRYLRSGSPLSSIENLQISPQSRSPTVFKTPVKVEEDVLVMDGILVGPVTSARTRSSSSTSDSGGSSSSGGKSFYKTGICRSWEDSSSCRYGAKCQFAHGKEELRPTRFPHKNRSEAQTCKSYSSGSRTYGSKCRCIHHHVNSPASPTESAVMVPFATTQTITPIKLEHALSSVDSSNINFASTDWSPLDDSIEVTLPSSTSTDKAPSREDVDAYIHSVLYCPNQRKKLPVFAEICPREQREMMKDEERSPAVNVNDEWEEHSSLYEAYNELHGLAQEFETPFDAPAVLVVGHQTDGKSALVEALMGFQFNHVGGGTKTRRPITLHMKFNPDCDSPLCHLLSDSDPSIAQEKSLQELQAYIEAENTRLEHEPCQFSAKEIIIKVEYKYCPNLTIIDTPGLVAPAPGRKNRALQAQARAVESLVRAKMQHKEFIILCLEDCNDWSNATTRRVVMQIDPEFARTVVVSTKLDTKIPQFACASDVEVFLSPPVCVLDGFMLGDSPFFTSVPSGRVGSGHESVYRSNDEFKQAISLREMEDVASLEEKLGRSLSTQERSRIGVSSLRQFLEELLRQRYMDSVPLIIPLLEKEYRSSTRKLNEINEELSTLDEVKLREKGRAFHDMFLTKLSLLLKGTVVAPPDKFGETLQDERANGGPFTATDGLQFPYKLIPNAGMRLYGGAQYHRAMAEFRFVVGGTKCPPITREEIVNACGVEDIHDGTNYSRTACVIAVAKARDTFEPFLQQLGGRLLHILKRLLPISVYLLQKDGEFLSGHEVFLRRVASAFNKFAESTERSCREKCMEDLVSTTRYVSWSLHNKNRAGLRQFLDSFGGSEQSGIGGNSVSANLSQDSSFGSVVNDKQEVKTRTDAKLSQLASGIDSSTSNQTTETRLADLLDSTLWNRRLAPSSERIVYALVQQIFHGIREYFLSSAELKFNCFLLMPVVDKLPALLREDLESAFEDNLDNVFDITNLRHSFGQQKRETEIELKRILRLQEKFKQIHEQLNSHQFVSRP